MEEAACLQLAHRMASLQPSATLAMAARAGAMKASGIDVIDLSVGEPDFPTPEPAIIPILCPLPTVNKELIAFIPTSRGSVIGFLVIGLIDLPLIGHFSWVIISFL